MDFIWRRKNFKMLLTTIFSMATTISLCEAKVVNSSEIKVINSISEVKSLLEKITPTTLVIFDIGETLAIQRNNLLRIIRNYRIFNKGDAHLMNTVITKFMKRDRNAKSTILSNMLLNSQLYLVEPEIKAFIHDLQKKGIKVLAHCSSKAKNFGAMKDFKNWRYSALKKLDLDFSSSFETTELSFLNLKDDQGFYPIFYNGLIFGGTPKVTALLALLDEIKFIPSEIIYFDDCKSFVRQYAKGIKKRNINFKGFVYQAALQPTPKLDAKIVDIQVRYMKKRKFIDDLKAQRIIKKRGR